MTDTRLEPLPPACLAAHGIREREHLQRLLRESIEVVAPGTMVLAEEFSEWEQSQRRIDLLCLDRQANLVVVELKRTDDGGHMELQALRYAAMVEPMTFERAVEAHQRYLADRGEAPAEAESRILEFLGWSEPDADAFAADTRIVLVAADFSAEITTTVIWLNERGLDLRCVRLAPHRLDDQIVLNVEQCLPLPELEQYQVRLREKSTSQRDARRQAQQWTGYWFVNVGDGSSAHRSWEDCRRYGFLIAGGGQRWIRGIQRLEVGDHVAAYLTGAGYVGLGRVTRAAVPQKDFVTHDGRSLLELPLHTPPDPAVLDDAERCDWCVGIEWLKTVDRNDGVLRSRAHRHAVGRIGEPDLVEALLQAFGLDGTEADRQLLEKVGAIDS